MDWSLLQKQVIGENIGKAYNEFKQVSATDIHFSHNLFNLTNRQVLQVLQKLKEATVYLLHLSNLFFPQNFFNPIND